MFESLKNQFAIVNSENVVTNVVMGETLESVEEVFSIGYDVKEVISCYTAGQAWIGGTWDGEAFSCTELSSPQEEVNPEQE